VYDRGRVVQVAPRGELLWHPASETVARILGLRNILQGTVLEATPECIRLRWRGQTLEARNRPDGDFLPAPRSALAFVVCAEDPRLLRKDGPPPDPDHHANILAGRVIREADLGVTRLLMLRLDEPGPPAQGDYDLEIEVPRFVYDVLRIDQHRDWQFSIRPGSICVLPSSLAKPMDEHGRNPLCVACCAPRVHLAPVPEPTVAERRPSRQARPSSPR